jgi:hypothetical protein
VRFRRDGWDGWDGCLGVTRMRAHARALVYAHARTPPPGARLTPQLPVPSVPDSNTT